MRKFNLKPKGSILRTIEEPKLKKKAWTLDRILYVILLLILLFVVLQFLYRFFNIIEGNGQIVFQKVTVNFTEDIRLTDIIVKKGMNLHKGDTLFRYKIEDPNADQQYQNNRLQAENKFSQENLDLEKEILLSNLLLEQKKAALKYKQQQIHEKVDMILLEVDNLQSLQKTKESATALKLEIQALKKKITSLNFLKSKTDQLQNQYLNGYGAFNMEKAYISPLDGISGVIHFEKNEICYREEEVLSIHNSEKVQIRAYFSQKHHELLHKGALVTVKFSDGSTTKGKIATSFIATYALPSEFQKKYEPTERTIVVDIVPMDKGDSEIWRKYYLMNVELIIHRWFGP